MQQSPSASLSRTLQGIIGSSNTFKQLWRGTAPSVVRTGFGSALYFSTLNALRQNIARSNFLGSTAFSDAATHKIGRSSSSLPKLSNFSNLATGALARASVGLITMPLTVIKVRYESNLYSYISMWDAVAGIWKHEGIRGFFAGFGATAVRDAPYAGLYVLIYEQSKRHLSSLQTNLPARQTSGAQRTMSSNRSVSVNFISGILAAGLATVVTNPFDAVKTRLQLMPSKYSNMLQAGRRMIREEGFRSLFDGLGLRMSRKAMSSALAWTLYEELIRRAELQWEDKLHTTR